MKQATYVEFVAVPNRTGRKTLLWDVRSKESHVSLGRISWYTRWRRYTFDPLWGTTFEHICLRDIADFIELQTRNHKNRRLNGHGGTGSDH